jgi:hypothetical protein
MVASTLVGIIANVTNKTTLWLVIKWGTQMQLRCG